MISEIGFQKYADLRWMNAFEYNIFFYLAQKKMLREKIKEKDPNKTPSKSEIRIASDRRAKSVPQVPGFEFFAVIWCGFRQRFSEPLR